MADEFATAALQGAAQALHQSAQAHKNLEFHHRKQARKIRRQLERLQVECKRRGITLEIEPAQTSERGHS